jgi:hypothetical protein
LKKKPPVVVSYYTKNTSYEKEAQNLIKSCKRLSLPYEIEAVDSLGSWEKNCCMKPLFLLEKLQKIKNPILWVDADGIILKPLHLFDFFHYDIALRINENLSNNHPSKIMTGTIYLSPTNTVKQVLQLWNYESQRTLAKSGDSVVWDQTTLRDVLQNLPLPVKVFPLPHEYCTIYDEKNTDHKKAVILQYQASRLYQKEVNGEVLPFWNQAGMTPEELTKTRLNHINKSLELENK